MKEQDIQSKILKFLNTVGYAIKIQSSSKSGVHDIIACIPNNYGVGVFYSFEVKNSSGGVVSELQKYNLVRIKKNGGKAYVVNSLEMVKEIVFYDTTTPPNN